MTTPPARLLICGFGSFPGFPDNPAARVVEALSEAHWTPPGVATTFQPLPTTWAGGFQRAEDTARAFGADAILVIGVAGGAEAFRVEAQGCNRAGTQRPDAEGVLHAAPLILADGLDAVAAAAPVAAMVAAIEADGLPVGRSTDAGDYLCNYVFYRLLAARTAPRIAFLHLPPGLEPEQLVQGAMAAARALVAD